MNKQNYLIGRIKKVSLKASMLFLIPLLIFLSMFLLISSALKTITGKSTAVTSQEEIILHSGMMGYIEFTVQDLEYTGLYTEENGEITHYTFFAVLPETGENIIVNLAKDSIPDLENPPATYLVQEANTKMDIKLADSIIAKHFEDYAAEYREIFTNYVVTEKETASGNSSQLFSTMLTSGSGATYLLLPVLFLLFLLIFAVRYLYLFANPTKHKTYRQLEKNSDNIKSDLANMDAEMASGGANFFKNAVITKSWIISNTFFRVFVNKMEDIIWFYVNETTTTNNVASVKSYGVYACNKAGVKYLINAKNEDQSHQILDLLHKIHPSAMFGFSFETDQMYINKRAEMIRQVEKRKDNPEA